MNKHIMQQTLNRKFWLRPLGRNFISCGVVSALSLFSIIFIDQELAKWIYDLHLPSCYLEQFVQHSVLIVTAIAGLILAFCPQRRSHGTKTQAILAAVVCGYTAVWLKTWLKTGCGRNWPLFWLGEWAASASPFANTYGFHFHLHSSWQGSFPSGHMTYISFLSLIMAQLYPDSKYFFYPFGILVLISLVILNFHFLGDGLGGMALALWLNNLFIGIHLLRSKFQKHNPT